MSLERLSARSVPDLDNGIVGELIDAAIASCASDLSDRGEDGQRRVVTVSIEMFVHNKKPITEVKVSSKLPAYRSNPTVHKERAIGGGESGLFFQTENAESADQATLEFEKG